MRVFLSYRRGDAAGHAGRLSDSLARHLGARSVFQDVAAIAPGEDYTVAIDRALDGSDVLLAVLGPRWVTAADEEGARRLDQPDDFVRLELARALARGMRVVPVLVHGARLPEAAELPEELRELTRRQAVTLHDETWHEDVDGLLRLLRGEAATPPPQRRRRVVVTIAVVAVLAAAGGAAWWLAADRDQEEPDIVAGCEAPGPAGWTRIPLFGSPVATAVADGGTIRVTVRAAWWKRAGSGRWQVAVETAMRNDTPAERYHGDWYYDYLAVDRRANPVTCFSATNAALVDPGQVGDAIVGFTVACNPRGYIELRVLGVTTTALTNPSSDAGCEQRLPPIHIPIPAPT